MSGKQKKTEKNYTPSKKSGSGFLFNTIIVVVIAAVFCLGVYAVASKYMENHPAEEKTKTVADFVKEKKITLDEFKTEYGLEEAEISEDTSIESTASEMTLENYAKYTESTLEELKDKYKLGEDVSADTTWQNAIDYMPTGIVSEEFFGMDFDSFKTQMSVPDTVTEDTLWSETNTIMNELYASQQESSSEDDAEMSEEANNE